MSEDAFDTTTAGENFSCVQNDSTMLRNPDFVMGALSLLILLLFLLTLQINAQLSTIPFNALLEEVSDLLAEEGNTKSSHANANDHIKQMDCDGIPYLIKFPVDELCLIYSTREKSLPASDVKVPQREQEQYLKAYYSKELRYFYRSQYNKIAPHLYLGHFPFSEGFVEHLASELDISLIINMMTRAEMDLYGLDADCSRHRLYKKHNILELRAPVFGTYEPGSSQLLSVASAAAYCALLNFHPSSPRRCNVYVHCRKGRGKSAAVVFETLSLLLNVASDQHHYLQAYMDHLRPSIRGGLHNQPVLRYLNRAVNDASMKSPHPCSFSEVAIGTVMTMGSHLFLTPRSSPLEGQSYAYYAHEDTKIEKVALQGNVYQMVYPGAHHGKLIFPAYETFERALLSSAVQSPFNVKLEAQTAAQKTFQSRLSAYKPILVKDDHSAFGEYQKRLLAHFIFVFKSFAAEFPLGFFDTDQQCNSEEKTCGCVCDKDDDYKACGRGSWADNRNSCSRSQGRMDSVNKCGSSSCNANNEGSRCNMGDDGDCKEECGCDDDCDDCDGSSSCNANNEGSRCNMGDDGDCKEECGCDDDCDGSSSCNANIKRSPCSKGNDGDCEERCDCDDDDDGDDNERCGCDDNDEDDCDGSSSCNANNQGSRCNKGAGGDCEERCDCDDDDGDDDERCGCDDDCDDDDCEEQCGCDEDDEDDCDGSSSCNANNQGSRCNKGAGGDCEERCDCDDDDGDNDERCGCDDDCDDDDCEEQCGCDDDDEDDCDGSSSCSANNQGSRCNKGAGGDCEERCDCDDDDGDDDERCGCDDDCEDSDCEEQCGCDDEDEDDCDGSSSCSANNEGSRCNKGDDGGCKEECGCDDDEDDCDGSSSCNANNQGSRCNKGAGGDCEERCDCDDDDGDDDERCGCDDGDCEEQCGCDEDDEDDCDGSNSCNANNQGSRCNKGAGGDCEERCDCDDDDGDDDERCGCDDGDCEEQCGCDEDDEDDCDGSNSCNANNQGSRCNKGAGGDCEERCDCDDDDGDDDERCGCDDDCADSDCEEQCGCDDDCDGDDEEQCGCDDNDDDKRDTGRNDIKLSFRSGADETLLQTRNRANSDRSSISKKEAYRFVFGLPDGKEKDLPYILSTTICEIRRQILVMLFQGRAEMAKNIIEEEGYAANEDNVIIV